MSYARFSENSDVYVFLSCQGHLECCACALHTAGTFESTGAMLAHLREHEDAGHLVPTHTAEALARDRVGNDRYIATGDESLLA